MQMKFGRTMKTHLPRGLFPVKVTEKREYETSLVWALC